MDSIVGLRFDRFRYHPPKQDFKSHRMSTAVVSYKKFAITGIDAILKGHLVIVVITMES